MTEDRREKHRRQLDELLAEIRVVLPGVQVLFAFLLTVPFMSSFHGVTAAQRIVYFVSFLATTAAMALLIVTPAYHRVRFQQRQKANIVSAGSRLALLALALLGVAVVGVVYLVTDVLYRWPVAVVVAAAISIMLAGLWYLFPITREGVEALSGASDESAPRGLDASSDDSRDARRPGKVA